MPAGKPKIRVERLTKMFGDLLVLDDLNFDIYDGEFLCVVGPTGCGKTTFCNVVSRLLPATRGSITMDTEEIDPTRHNISFVFQEPSCIPWRTVWQDIGIGLEIKGINSREAHQRLVDIINMVELKGFEKFYPHQLSAGMKQRVAIARAFVTEPDLLLMDEPFGQLDTSTRFQIENRLIEVWQKTKRTVIFVTHNLEEAVYLAERILVLTNKPTTVKEVVHVRLPRPRNFADPEFVKIRRRVTDLVKWW
ncbi:MAG: ABC transporter ATP-binding protein [Deltaproteobacteria bacterium]|nr:ABC transporter ATP-binding protein [Deltaproteobacteria bacterium]MBW2308364.1 ABC transporter ATP-binding protein [Deltaproteobacteria bacterium]